MAVLSGATASGRTLICGNLTTTAYAILYTAPTQTTNVTSPSATAYIKDIEICNTSGNSTNVTLALSNSTTAGTGCTAFLASVAINPNDTKLLGGLNIMIPAGWTIQGYASTANVINVIASGVEVQ